jgi:hypothetical protein
MKERPLNLKAWEVRAILDGRKTQIRRVVKNQGQAWKFWRMFPTERGDRFAFRCNLTTHDIRCPYGQPGDRLWVRETFFHEPEEYDYVSGRVRVRPVKLYRADGHGDWIGKWTPSIHMPRWASRITLEMESVRVKRLHEISEEDAKAEGIFEVRDEWAGKCGDFDETLTDRQLYSILWESINGPGSWGANPWVWVVTFRRV